MNLAEQEIKSSSKKEDEQNLKFSIAHSGNDSGQCINNNKLYLTNIQINLKKR